MLPAHEYEKVDTADSNSQYPYGATAPTRSTMSRILLTIAGVILATAIVTLVLVGSIFAIVKHNRDEVAAPSAEVIGCGNSTSDARLQGCVFDVMMQLWVPPLCYNHELSERFLAEGQWAWYRDSRAEYEMSDEEMRRGEHEVAYVVDSYHRQHCVYTWQLTVRALRDQTDLLEEMLNYKHVQHCRKILMAPKRNVTEQGTMGVQAVSGFTTCAAYRTWLNQLEF